MFSWTIHLDIKDELLFAMLFFGFRRFPASFPCAPRSMEFPSPNAGADPSDRIGLLLPEIEVPASLLAATSAEGRPSWGLSCMLVWMPDRTLLFVFNLNKECGSALELIDNKEILVPAVAGCGVVARGLGLIIGVSEG